MNDPIDARTPQVADDLRVLSAVEARFAGTEGERAMLRAVRERLPAGVRSRIEGFVDHLDPSLWVGIHATLLLGAGVLGFWMPALGAVLCSVFAISLVGEGTGRFRLLRALAPRWPSYNLSVPLVPDPGPRGSEPEPALGAIVVTAPLDAPRWRQFSWIRFRVMKILFGAALIVTGMLVLRSLAEPWGPRTLEIYVGALVVLAGAVLLGGIAHRMGDRREEASGPTALLELVRRLAADPVEGVQVHAVFTGCGRAFQGGMAAYLDAHGRGLPDPVLVIALDDPGRPPLQAIVSEGPLLSQAHLPTGPAVVERMRWAGVAIPAIDHHQATDARAARVRGYRALAFTGGGDGPSTLDGTLRAVDAVETVVRWYGEDLTRLADHRTALGRLLQQDAPEKVEVVEPVEDAAAVEA